ncbi:hypothetical protein [Streptomyces prunicolor]|uniref:hypothetical protein n=1 Tax=Streptomyces prunicolor TaxID=67348 RepID=UPI00341F0AB8
MRKRPSRPARFASIDNEAIDSLPSILSIGLLTRLVRAKDGDEVTVESLTKEYAEGEAALSKAMRALVEAALVVKFKIQRAASEAVVDEATGTTVVKRGGSWFTTFTVDSIPHTREDAAEMLREILDGGNVKAVRIEPQYLDPRKDEPSPTPARPTPPNAGVGATCGNVGPESVETGANPEDSGPRPTPLFPASGRPTPGHRGALIRKKTLVKDSLPSGPTGHAGAEVPEKREISAAQGDSHPAEAAVAFVADLPGRLGGKTAHSLAPLVEAAFADGYTPATLRTELGERVDVTRINHRGALPGLYERALTDLPPATSGRERCPDHPARYRRGCMDCALAVPA